MIRAIVAAAVLGLLGLARPACADSDAYFIQIGSITSSALVISTGAAHGPVKSYALQVKGSTTTAYASQEAAAAASAWDVRLQGSLDGLHYSDIMAHVTGDGDGALKVSTAPAAFPATWLRLKVNSLTLGSSASGIDVRAIGSQ